MQTDIRAHTREPWSIVEKDDNYVLASWQQIFAVVWRQDTTLEGAQALQRECCKFATKHPRGIGLLTIVSEKAPMPASPVRQAVADFLGQGSTYIKCSAVLMEGTGFRAAAVRSVVTGLTMLAKQAYPHRVCSLPDAVTLLAKTLPVASGRAVNPTALRTAIDELRQCALP
jgi:hypothetical protein